MKDLKKLRFIGFGRASQLTQFRNVVIYKTRRSWNEGGGGRKKKTKVDFLRFRPSNVARSLYTVRGEERAETKKKTKRVREWWEER